MINIRMFHDTEPVFKRVNVPFVPTVGMVISEDTELANSYEIVSVFWIIPTEHFDCWVEADCLTYNDLKKLGWIDNDAP